MLKLLKPNIGENVTENAEKELENETRSFYTPQNSVRKNSTQPTTIVQVVTWWQEFWLIPPTNQKDQKDVSKSTSVQRTSRSM